MLREAALEYRNKTWRKYMRIRPEDTSAIVIDYQEKIVPAMANKEALLKKTVILLKGLQLLGIPMILTTQYAKGLGMNLPEITEAIGSEAYIDKGTFSVYDSHEAKAKLGTDRKNVIICGIEAHICVLQTIIDLVAAGYQPILVADCVSSRSVEDKEMALLRAQQEGALITTTESILYELLQKSGSDTFKQISKLIK